MEKDLKPEQMKYEILCHFDDRPQMPIGYFGMLFLNSIPPLWYFFIDKWLYAFKLENIGSELR